MGSSTSRLGAATVAHVLDVSGCRRALRTWAHAVVLGHVLPRRLSASRSTVHDPQLGSLVSYRHDRGASVCADTAARPVYEIDAEIIAWVKRNVLQEGVIKRLVAEVRRRIEKQSKTHGTDVERLEAQATKLRKEVRNLSEAIAMADVSLPSLVERLAARQTELTKLEAQVVPKRTAPSVLSLECRRLERDVIARLDDLRGVLSRHPKHAREAFRALLIDKLTFRPVPTKDGKRYEVEGRLAIGGLLRLPASSLVVASPAGVEPALAT